MRNDKLLWEFKIMSHYDTEVRVDVMTRKKWEGICLDPKLKKAHCSKQEMGGWELRDLRGLINGVVTHT